MEGLDDPLRYYNDEITYLRQMGQLFARSHPKVAAQLEITHDQTADPHVERLIESFAFLTARIRRQLDSQFPEISSSLLSVLYPHLVNPVPPMAIARFEVDPDQGKLTDGFPLAKGMPLFAQTQDALTCRFRTCYPVRLWPINVTDAGFLPPAHYQFLDGNPNVASVLRIRLAGLRSHLSELTTTSLRFYLNGDLTVVHGLYTLLFEEESTVALLPGGSAVPRYLHPRSIQPVGFGADEEVIPYPVNSHPAYRLIQEYFLFPQKFLFFDVNGLNFSRIEGTADILILLKNLPASQLTVNRRTFLLGCTPVTNLFPRTTEPIRLDQSQLSYRLIPDLRREKTTEIHSVLTVSASMNPGDERTRFAPFYGFHHTSEGQDPRSFWHMRRLPTGRSDLPGTDVQLSFLDLDFNPHLPPQQTVFAHTLCTNRALARQLSAGTILQIEERAPLTHIVCHSKPTPTVYPPLGGETIWNLISNLSLNYLSLSGGEAAVKALREILHLYSFSQYASTYRQIEGIRDIRSRKVIRRAGPEAWRGFTSGTEITLELDEDFFSGTGPFLMGAVLHRFFALYASLNSFTQLNVRSKHRESQGMRWPPLAGCQPVT